MIPQPVFLVGAERSGTTILRLMLGYHPAISWCNEFEYAVDLVEDEEEWPDLEHYRDWLRTNRVFRASGFTLDPSLDYPNLVDSFLLQKRKREGKPLVGGTVHRNFDRLTRIWPDARFIHMVRDGRDVARSCLGMGWASNVWYGIQRWIDAESTWRDMKRTLPEERRFELAFERLVREPRECLAEVCEFIGVPFDPRMLEYHESTTYDPPDPGIAQQWRSRLSERDVQLIEARIGPQLVELGYELSGLPPRRPSRPERVRLWLHNRWGRHAFRRKRYGLAFWFAEVAARRLRIPRLYEAVQLRKNELDEKLLQ